MVKGKNKKPFSASERFQEFAISNCLGRNFFLKSNNNK